MTSASATAAPAKTKPKPAVGARRIALGLLLAAVGLGAVAWPPAFSLIVLLVATGCIYEFAGLSARQGPALELPVAMGAVWAYVALTHFGLIHRYEGILIAATVVVALATVTFTRRSGYFARSGYTLLAVLYIGKLLTYFIAIRALHDGALWTIWVIVLVACTDIFAMLVGSALGCHPLTRLSPGKTVEGAVGGFAAALLAGGRDRVDPGRPRRLVAGPDRRRHRLGRRPGRRPGRERAQTRRPRQRCGPLDRRPRRRAGPLRLLHLRRDRILLRPVRDRRDLAEPADRPVSARKVAILGSTGSIGRQALDVIGRHPERFAVVGLAAGRNTALLAEQAARFRPPIVSAGDAEAATDLMLRLGRAAAVASGPAGLLAVATQSGADIVLAATDGAVAFDAVFAAVDAGIDVAVANKELVVAAGELLVAHAARSGARLLPVDSEHSAIFQCLQGAPPERVAALVLTASGGPFWERSAAAMATATLADALAHPTWQMGVKNTIDSATLMNKGLEVIEAAKWFGVPAQRIHVLVHRTSVAHGFVVFSDGQVVAQLAPPDMRLPIGYALAYPDRLADRPFGGALEALGGAPGAATTALAFERPDLERFPCLRLAYDALALGGTAPAAVSAANEVAVRAFVDDEIRFGDIAACIETALARVGTSNLSLDAVRVADRSARAAARAFVTARTSGAPRRS